MFETLLFVAATLAPLPPLPRLSPALCHGTSIALEADGYRSGTQGYDRPEFMRGLHARGDSAGAPIDVSLRDGHVRFFVWAVDTRLDGVEEYDRIAVSESPDAINAPDALIELEPGAREHLTLGSRELDLLVPHVNAGLLGLSLCVEEPTPLPLAERRTVLSRFVPLAGRKGARAL